MKLEIKDITKSYGNIKALSGVSLELTEGIYGLLGPNGSGKTTLINIITDNLYPDSGKILFDSIDTKKLGVNFREKIGFMPQYPGMYLNFSIEMFLKYIATIKGISASDALEQIENTLKEVDLYEVRKQKIKTLSGGMKQRLALAQAVIGNPQILILDEPTAGLDPEQRISIRNYISRISTNKIVLIATHVVPDVEYIAKQIIFLKKGEVLANTAPNELIKSVEGKVWSAEVSNEEAIKYQNSLRISRAKNTGDKVLLRIISDEQPIPSAVKVAPTLEDCYLYYFGETVKQYGFA